MNIPLKAQNLLHHREAVQTMLGKLKEIKNQCQQTDHFFKSSDENAKAFQYMLISAIINLEVYQNTINVEIGSQISQER